MNWDLFDLVYDEYKHDKREEQEVKEAELEIKKEEQLRYNKKKDLTEKIILYDQHIAKGIIILVMTCILSIICKLLKNTLIISIGITLFKFLWSISLLFTILSFLFIGKSILSKLICFREIKKIRRSTIKDISYSSLSSKEKYIGISDIRNELLTLMKKVSYNFRGEPGEDGIAKKIIQQCLDLLDKISNLNSALKTILERSEEYSLEEVIDTLKQAEESIGRNIFKITNRIVLELNIEGFEENQINRYLKNNEDILSECTKLVKESLEYIESKDNLDNNTIGIETLTETLQSLKKQLNKDKGEYETR